MGPRACCPPQHGVPEHRSGRCYAARKHRPGGSFDPVLTMAGQNVGQYHEPDSLRSSPRRATAQWGQTRSSRSRASRIHRHQGNRSSCGTESGSAVTKSRSLRQKPTISGRASGVRKCAHGDLRACRPYSNVRAARRVLYPITLFRHSRTELPAPGRPELTKDCSSLQPGLHSGPFFFRQGLHSATRSRPSPQRGPRSAFARCAPRCARAIIARANRSIPRTRVEARRKWQLETI